MHQTCLKKLLLNRPPTQYLWKSPPVIEPEKESSFLPEGRQDQHDRRTS